MRSRFKNRFANTAAVAAAALAWAVAAPAQQPAKASVSVESAWVRSLPGNAPAAGYLKLHNLSNHSVDLVAASSPDYGQVQLHRSTESGGTMHMEEVNDIAIEAGAHLDFSKLGYHLMLMQPHHPLRVGDHVKVSLSFKDGATLETELTVRGARGEEHVHDDMKDMPGMNH